MGPHSGAIFERGKVDQRAMDAVREFAGLASDSREVRPGYLFAALPGNHADGAHYICDAVKRGASAVLARPEEAAKTKALGVRFIGDENPRARLAHFAAAFFGPQPATVAAVTGTNGKTSVTVFLRQIWAGLGKPAASLGTIGAVTPSGEITLKNTTPDPIEIHRLMAQIKRGGVDWLALEASSHGLDQSRLDGVDVAAGAFTNITRDHLDYHHTFDAYLAAKLRLFTHVVRRDGAAVINADAEHSEAFQHAAQARDLKVFSVGVRGEHLTLVSREPAAGGQTLRIRNEAREYDVMLPLAGEFQVANALVAAGLAIALGDGPADALRALTGLKGAPGRMEKVAYTREGAPIYVDYAHTPDALETVLKAMRPHVGGKLYVIFGCGGDRDRGKRPLMGAAAAQFADGVIVTDDNPRSEDPAAIRKAALAGAPNAREICDRAAAIRAGIASLAEGDVLVIAGKGHETGQTIGRETRPFSDRDEAIAAARESGGHGV